MNNYLVALEGMKTLLVEIESPLEGFKKKQYPDHFHFLYEKSIPMLDAIEAVYTSVIEPEAFLDNMASAMVESALEKLENCKKRSQKENLMMDLNMSMAIYVFPILLEYKGKSTQPLVDKLLAKWKEAFPKSNLQAAKYEYIEQGFHKKFCYITTAVCETFHKPDNCYELTLLRNYRDDYLANQPDGEELIRAYYDMAPTIVKHISQRRDAGQIYAQIWEEYLSPCISMIEEGDPQGCQNLYIKMVETLKESYFYLS
ncbi:MAG: CFI-box-CTERM domain-containing protein [Lachnospiraceae bacterium]|nr:CFI-box-CTERM domain-containing protein [Lachnospiraceae bacterium]